MDRIAIEIETESAGPAAFRRPNPPLNQPADSWLRRGGLALAALFFIAHAASLPTTFADVDAINFALGVRDFDVAKHQPHPPGYPVFIAAAKASTAFMAGVGVSSPDVRGLAILSAIAGACLLPLLFLFYSALIDHRVTAAWAAVATVASPLLWLNAFRPLSDVTGLAVVVLAQALLASVILGRRSESASRRLILGALVAGVAIGVRSQSFVLTLPLFAVTLVMPRTGVTARARLFALVALVAGGLSWFIPLLVASGGPEAYLEALRNQAGEDFTGVVMLWTMRSARVAIDAVEYSFFWPWGTLVAGWIVVAAAAIGGVRMLLRKPGALAVLVVAFAPYAAFHLLFQETVTTRYALPLVAPVALLAVYAMAGAGRLVLHAGCVVLVAWSMVVTLPGARMYSGRPTPAYRALRDALAASEPAGLVAMHAVMLRPEQWYHDNASGRVIRSRHGGEIPALVERWRQEPDARVMFIANSRRSDLAMLDPRSRTLAGAYEWGFPELPLLGGVRPGQTAVFALAPPAWMLGPGWALTAEIGGQTQKAGAEPHRRPAVAWIRTRDGESALMIGGRNLESAGSPSARITLSIRGQVFDAFAVPPGYFFETRTISAGTLTGSDAYLPLEVMVSSTSDASVRVSLEQFDLQSSGVPMMGAADGWHEPEYDPTSGRTWRWMSDRATLWVRPVGRDVTLTVSGESPLRYFDEPPLVRVLAAGRVLAEFSPSTDFTRKIHIPAEALAASDQRVVIESDKSFVPGNGDKRRLALRVYATEVN